MRITLKQLGTQLAQINKSLPEDKKLGLCQAYGGVKVVRDADGAKTNVSPRGTAKDVYQFLSGMVAAMEMKL